MKIYTPQPAERSVEVFSKSITTYEKNSTYRWRKFKRKN